MSNIWAGLRRQADLEGEWRSSIRLHAEHLQTLLTAGRPQSSSVVVANADTPGSALGWFRGHSEVVTLEKGAITGSEQANDEKLQTRIYQSLFAGPPGILVLATGDGAGSLQGRGFVPALDAARTKRWKIEVLAWGNSTNERLAAWAQKQGVLIDLADFYYAISFEEGGRRAQVPSLRHRPTA